jgi:catechol 2,3-dioxygenase-like lactoylglutathione lyase family enzyme
MANATDIVPIINVPDVVATVRFYVDKLGFGEEWLWGEPPFYGGISMNGHKIHFKQTEPAHSTGSGIFYLMVRGVDHYHETYRNNGVEIVDPIGDRRYGLRDFAIHDLNGYRIAIGEDITE